MESDILAGWREYPEMFVEQVLGGAKRYAKQIEIMESVRDNRETLVRSCHGAGKTFSASDVVLYFLLTHIPSKVITTAPSWSQVEKLLWSEINSKFQNMKIRFKGITALKTELRADDDWFAVGISPKLETGDEGSRMVGFHSPNMLIVFDEAPAVNERLWKIKETLMTSQNVRFLGIGNPVSDSGSFYDAFRTEGVSKIHMSIFDSPNFLENGIKDMDCLMRMTPEQMKAVKIPYPALTTPEWVMARAKKWGEDSQIFKSRVLGEFPTVALDTIISLALINKAGQGSGMPGKSVLGVDVARYGNDFSCLIGFRDGKQTFKVKYNGLSITETAGRVIDSFRKNRWDVIVIDDTGMGGGVTDLVSESGIQTTVVPVNFAGASTDETYDGIITQMWYEAKDAIAGGLIVPEDQDDLYAQLSDRKYRYTSKGKIKAESKEEYKKRTGKGSPDESDAFILACHGLKFDTNGDGVGGIDGAESGSQPF